MIYLSDCFILVIYAELICVRYSYVSSKDQYVSMLEWQTSRAQDTVVYAVWVQVPLLTFVINYLVKTSPML